MQSAGSCPFDRSNACAISTAHERHGHILKGRRRSGRESHRPSAVLLDRQQHQLVVRAGQAPDLTDCLSSPRPVTVIRTRRGGPSGGIPTGRQAIKWLDPPEVSEIVPRKQTLPLYFKRKSAFEHSLAPPCNR